MSEAKEKTKKKKTTSKSAGRKPQSATTKTRKTTKKTGTTKSATTTKKTATQKTAAKKSTKNSKVVKILPEDKSAVTAVIVKQKTKKVKEPQLKVEEPKPKIEEPKAKNEKPKAEPKPKRIIEDIRPEPAKTVAEKPAEKSEKLEKPKETEKKAEKPKKKPHGRSHSGLKRFLLVIACAAAAVFAIVYFVNLNTPNVELRLASIQTGIEGNTYPNYIPRDYSLSSFTAETGKIVLYFENRSTGEAFSLSAENSSWDSNSLYANFVKGNYSDNYAVIKEQGLTLYMDSNKACWVNGGVLYKLNVTSGTLTKKQIKAIAVSL